MNIHKQETKIIISGFGGQGVLFLGKYISMLAMKLGLKTTWFPSYGAEMRGGTANCSVITSPEYIYSPIIDVADIVIALNQPSYDKFVTQLNPEGYLFYNSSIITPDNRTDNIKNVISINANAIADKIIINGPINIVFIAEYMKRFVPEKEYFYQILKEMLSKKKAKYIDINTKIFNEVFK